MGTSTRRKTVGFLITVAAFGMMGGGASGLTFDSGVVTLNQNIASKSMFNFNIDTNGFSIPLDTIYSADLTINATGVNGTKDTVDISNILFGKLNSQQGKKHFSSTVFNLLNTDISQLTNGENLRVGIQTGTQGFTLDSYELKVNYSAPSASSAPAPVPEPASILLLGAGIFAMVVYSKRQTN